MGGLWRLGVVLKNERNVLAKSHPLFVLRAVLLSALAGSDTKVDWAWRTWAPVGSRIKRGAHYGLWVYSADPQWLESFAVALQSYLADTSGEMRNFSLQTVHPAAPRLWAEIWAEHTAGLIREDGGWPEEVCLDFHTPFAFAPHHPQQRWRLEPAELQRSLAGRAQALGLPSPGADLLVHVELLPWFWDFHRHGATSRSNAAKGKGKTEEPLTGCQGPLYLRGQWQGLLPWLVLAAELGVGRRLSLGQGACRLVVERPFFDPFLENPSRYHPAYAESREGRLDHGLRDGELNLAELETAAAELPVTEALAARDRICAGFAQRVRQHDYRPGPVVFFPLLKKDGTHERQIALLPEADKIFQRTLHSVLAPVCDRQLEPCAHGYRPGHGVESARAALAESLRSGASWVVETDVASFFDQIPWEGLDAAVHRAVPVSDAGTRSALRACYHRADSATPGRGLLQGSPLSPLLANLFLDRLDETLVSEGWRPVRYGDDLVIPAKDQAEAKVALARLEALLGALGLALSPEKTALTPVAAGFTFLGRSFGAGVEEGAIAEQALRRTVYVAEPFTMVALDHDALVVRRGKELLARAPLARVEAVVIHGTQAVSTPLITACAKRRIPITFAGVTGYTVNVLRPDSRAFFDHISRHSARHAAQSPHQRVQSAAALVRAKIHNLSAWLASRREPGIRAALPELQSLAARAVALETTPPREANPKLPLGLEGAAAALVYPLVSSLALNPAWHSERRLPKEKADRWNALYDFAANLLFARLNAAIRSAGLNPYLGWLHSAEDNYESLVCDVMEPFRARLDRWLLRTLNREIVRPEDMAQDAGGRWRFDSRGGRRLIESWEEELQHRQAGEPGTLAELLHSQVTLLCEWALCHQPMQWYQAPTQSSDIKLDGSVVFSASMGIAR